MKTPSRFDSRTHQFERFVHAAENPQEKQACQLLMTHVSDLLWHEWVAGIFLGRVRTGRLFARAVDRSKARSSIKWASLLPRLMDVAKIAGELRPRQETTESEVIVGSAEQKSRDSARQVSMDGSRLLGQALPATIDWFGHFLSGQAQEIRLRHSRAAHPTESSYDEMVNALLNIGGMIDFSIRICPDWSGERLDIHFSSGTMPDESANAGDGYAELFRVADWIWELKSGQDLALPLFIADFINRHSGSLSPAAFAGARYGSKSEDELDVVVPSEAVAFEVKLYQCPMTQTGSKLEGHGKRLASQLKSYFNRGCERVYVVTNLGLAGSAALVDYATQSDTSIPRSKVQGIGELDSLLGTLREVSTQVRKRKPLLLGT